MAGTPARQGAGVASSPAFRLRGLPGAPVELDGQALYVAVYQRPGQGAGRLISLSNMPKKLFGSETNYIIQQF